MRVCAVDYRESFPIVWWWTKNEESGSGFHCLGSVLLVSFSASTFLAKKWHLTHIYTSRPLNPKNPEQLDEETEVNELTKFIWITAIKLAMAVMHWSHHSKTIKTPSNLAHRITLAENYFTYTGIQDTMCEMSSKLISVYGCIDFSSYFQAGSESRSVGLGVSRRPPSTGQAPLAALHGSLGLDTCPAVTDVYIWRVVVERFVDLLNGYYYYFGTIQSTINVIFLVFTENLNNRWAQYSDNTTIW